jgi:tRNA pseudouridine65 synthase
MSAPLPLIHDDAHLLAVDKPAGLLVHRTRLDAHEPDDLMTRLRSQCGAALWPAHRLDKGCSGVLLLARDVDTARRLGAAFAAGRVTKHYLALVRGWPAGRATKPPAARWSRWRPRAAAGTRSGATSSNWPIR